MKKIVLFLCLILSSYTYAKISTELATVKASYEFGIEEERNLLEIYDVLVEDSGEILTVSLFSKTLEQSCVDWYWFDYYGNLTECPDCSDDDTCFCVVGHCDDNRTGKRVIRKRKI